MNKKSILMIISIAVLGIILTSLIVVNGDDWLFKKEPVHISAKNQKIIDRNMNVNPKTVISATSNQTVQSDIKIKDKFKSKTIKLDMDGHNVELAFNYVIENESYVLLPLTEYKSGDFYEVITWPQSNKSIIEYEGSLYVVDLRNESIEKLLQDEYGNKTFQEIKQKAEQISKENGNNVDTFVWWGTGARVSPNGKHLVFNTNRSGESEVWLKNLDDGKELPIMKLPINVEAWINDDHFIGTSFSEIIQVNIHTHETISYGDGIVTVSHPYIIVHKEQGSIEIHNFPDETIKTFDKGIHHVIDLSILENSPSVAMINMPDATEPKYELLVVNAESLDMEKFDILDGKTFYSMKWIDENSISILVKDEELEREETIVIELGKQ